MLIQTIEPCYYFGCGLYGAGHFLWGPFMSPLDYDRGRVDPFGPLDGKYCKPTTPLRENERESFLTLKDGWTILAMWDRSKDERYASNCAFFCQGYHNETQMWEIAYTYFPQIVERLQERRRA